MQEEDDEESASLGDVLEILMKQWPKGFTPLDLAKMVNNPFAYEGVDVGIVRDFLLAGVDRFVSGISVGRLLKPHIDAVVSNGLVLRKHQGAHANKPVYRVICLKKDG